MPTMTTDQAVEKIAAAVGRARASTLEAVCAELDPEAPTRAAPSAEALARRIRDGLEPEALVDLWNVVFPADRNVWYNEETKAFYFNEEAAGYPG